MSDLLKQLKTLRDEIASNECPTPYALKCWADELDAILAAHSAPAPAEPVGELRQKLINEIYCHLSSAQRQVAGDEVIADALLPLIREHVRAALAQREAMFKLRRDETTNLRDDIWVAEYEGVLSQGRDKTEAINAAIHAWHLRALAQVTADAERLAADYNAVRDALCGLNEVMPGAPLGTSWSPAKQIEFLRDQVDAAVAAALEQAAWNACQHCRAGIPLSDKWNHSLEAAEKTYANAVADSRCQGAHIRSLATQPQRDALERAQASSADKAFDRLWELMRDGWETQKAMDKIREELENASAKS